MTPISPEERQRVRDLLEVLTRTKSVSGSEDEIASFLENVLEDFGYSVKREKNNVLVNPNKNLIVTAHMDTVPIKREFSLDAAYAYGTGSCDDKASITAILEALREIEELNFGIALFYDEEENGTGSMEYAHRYRPKMAVVMEPTSLNVASTHYGSLEVIVRARGISAHGAHPEKGINAIEECIKFYYHVKSIPGIMSSMQMIRGGSDELVIPERCEGRIEVLFPPEIKSRDVIGAIVRGISHTISIEIKDSYDGTYSRRVDRLLEKALMSIGLIPKRAVMKSWTDALNLAKVGCDVVVWGPGELYRCHTEKERVSIDEIVIAKRALVALNKIVREEEC
ncbi:MAG: peptidase M20 [Thermoplasmata archaeon]|nr:MAG: peptidase M20 [Thermoplasmata archaeon]